MTDAAMILHSSRSYAQYCPYDRRVRGVFFQGGNVNTLVGTAGYNCSVGQLVRAAEEGKN